MNINFDGLRTTVTVLRKNGTPRNLVVSTIINNIIILSRVFTEEEAFIHGSGLPLENSWIHRQKYWPDETVLQHQKALHDYTVLRIQIGVQSWLAYPQPDNVT